MARAKKMEDEFPDKYTSVKWWPLFTGMALGVVSCIVYEYDCKVHSSIAHSAWHLLLFVATGLCVFALPVQLTKIVKVGYKPAGDVPAARDYVYHYCVYVERQSDY